MFAIIACFLESVQILFVKAIMDQFFDDFFASPSEARWFPRRVIQAEKARKSVMTDSTNKF